MIYLYGVAPVFMPAFGWTDVVEEFFGPHMPWAKFVLPTAPTVPVTLNGGMPMPAWVCSLAMRMHTLEGVCGAVSGS